MRILLAAALLVGASLALPRETHAGNEKLHEATVNVYRTSLTQPLWKTSAVAAIDSAFIFGGEDVSGNPIISITEWKPSPPSIHTWTTAALPTGRSSTSAVWDGQAAYIIGGITSGGPTRDVIKFVPSTSTVTTYANVLPTARSGTSAALHNGLIYIFGGYDTDELSQVLVLDPDTMTTTVHPTHLPTARTGTSAVSTGTEILVFGGHDGTSPLKQVWFFEPTVPVSSTANQLGEIPWPVWNSAAVWNGENAIVLGGRNAVEASRDIFMFNPATHEFKTYTAELDGRREAPSAVWLGDHVDFFGGRNNTAVSKWVQQFRPPSLLPAGGSLEYNVDGLGLQDDFAADGKLSLEVPVDGFIDIQGTEVPFLPTDTWLEIADDGTETTHPYENTALEGSIVGEPESFVNFFIGPSGIYGTITRPSSDGLYTKVYQFQGYEDEGGGTLRQQVILDVRQNIVDANVDLPLDPTDELGNIVPPPIGAAWPSGCTVWQSYVQLDADYQMRQVYPNSWYDRVAGGFKAHHGSYAMWKDLCIELLPRTIRGIPGVIYDDYHSRENYAQWLVSNQPNGKYLTPGTSGTSTPLSARTTNAYQLWTGHNIKTSCPGPDNGLCLYGVSLADRARHNWEGHTWEGVWRAQASASTRADSTSVAEGVDHNYDYYDATSTWQRGIVGGHELSHTYGEGNERDSCRDSSHCNIMQMWTRRANVDTYWIDKSRCEVYRWYRHYDTVYNKLPDGAWEPCPNWY